MAGLDDYKFYMAARSEDSPFWERRAPPPQRARAQPRPTSLPLNQEPGPDTATSANTQYLVVGANAAGLLAEHVLTHPLVVLRRQCQVNGAAHRYHLTPLTLAPVLYNMQRHQGLAVLWKGLGSCLIVRGLRLAAEDLVSKMTPWPRELARGVTWRQAGRHLALKTTALAMASPFAAASLTESVQSEVASERPGLLDVLTEGACRAVAGLTPHAASGRLLPSWTLAGPEALFGLLHYILSTAAAELSLLALRLVRQSTERRRGAVPRARHPLDACHDQLAAAAAGRYVAELLLYPLETALHRLQLQGTRSIIDNLDTGTTVLPVCTRYTGLLDCLRTVAAEEGVSGLYKGVGALLAQAALHGVVLHGARVVLAQLALITAGKPVVPPAATLAADELDAAAAAAEQEGEWQEVRTPLTPAAGEPWDRLGPRSREERYAEYEREFERLSAPERSRFGF